MRGNNMQERTERIEFNVTPEEKEFIQENAYQKGMTVSGYMRFLAIKRAKALVLPAWPEVLKRFGIDPATINAT
jgi:uncharacterized protein (DUF1778 family)